MDLQNLAFNVFFHHGYWLNVCSLQNSIKEAAIRGTDQVLLVSKDLKQHKPTSSFASGCNWGCLDCMPLTHSSIKLVSKDASMDAIIAIFISVLYIGTYFSHLLWRNTCLPFERKHSNCCYQGCFIVGSWPLLPLKI